MQKIRRKQQTVDVTTMQDQYGFILDKELDEEEILVAKIAVEGWLKLTL